MSVQAMSFVIENSRQKGSALLLMIIIANHAHADGSNAFPDIKTLARESRMSTRQCTRIIANLEISGDLIIHRSAGRKSHNYTVNMSLNHDKMSVLDKTNHDISSTPTMTNRAFNHDKSCAVPNLQNKELLVNRHEPLKNRHSARARNPVGKVFLPSDFFLSGPMVVFAQKLGGSPWTELDIGFETEQFKDHAIAKNLKYANWEAAWRNWMRNAIVKGWGNRQKTTGEKQDEILQSVNGKNAQAGKYDHLN